VHFVLRNGADRQEYEGPPVLLSQLSGNLPAPPAAQKPAPKHVEIIVSKPTYSVETILGSKQRMDSF
jgi:hypothetical protein